MNSGIAILPQVWSWYAGFFVSMGTVLAAATAFTLGILLTHWLYLSARNIESKPTPSYPRAVLRLSGFQAVVTGAVLVPFVTITVYYLLFLCVWKFAPAMPSTPPNDIPFPDVGSGSTDEWFAGMASLVMSIGALAILIAGTAFLLLRSYARTIGEGTDPVGFIKRVVRRYFHESVIVGFLLTLIACLVLFYFLYNTALLVMYVMPSTTRQLHRLTFSGAETIYVRSLQIIGSWLVIVLFIPASLLLLKGLRLRWRYTMENPIMNVIFSRSLKSSCLGLFAYAGSILMYFLADFLFRFFVETAFR